MGCDTKGVVLTAVKDVMLVSSIVENTLNNLIAEERRIQFPHQRAWESGVRDKFQNVRFEMTPASEMVIANFRFNEESRSLHLFFSCDCDNTDLAASSLSMSMGCWGQSGLFVKSVLHALSIFGQAWFDLNDCDSTDKALLEEPVPTILQALSLGYLTPYDVEKMAQRDDLDKLFPGQSFEAVFGVRKEDILQEEEEPASRRKALEALARAQPMLAPSFVEEFNQEQALKNA